MSPETLRTITDRCALTGRTFAHEAKEMARSEKISQLDPRVLFRNTASSKRVPQDIEDIKKVWSEFLKGVSVPSAAAPSMMLAEKIIKGESTKSIQRDLAACMESAALHIHEKEPGNPNIQRFVGMASNLCDGAVLGLRHRHDKNSVSSVSESERIPPQRVLAGMMRMGLVTEKDFRVSAFIEGHLEKANALSREEYFRFAKTTISNGMGLLDRNSIKPDSRKEIGLAVKSLSKCNTYNGDRTIKEITVLNANAKLAEHIGLSIDAPEKADLRKELAAVSMSSSARAISLLEDASLKKSMLLQSTKNTER